MSPCISRKPGISLLSATYVLPIERTGGHAKLKAKLTKKVVDAIKAVATETIVWDTELKGFGLKSRRMDDDHISYITARARASSVVQPSECTEP